MCPSVNGTSFSTSGAVSPQRSCISLGPCERCQNTWRILSVAGWFGIGHLLGAAQYNSGNEVDWRDLIFPWTRSVVESLITKRLIPLHVSPAAFPTDLEGC